MHSAVVGFGLGFLVAAQLGPMSLFLIRSTLRGGWRLGLAIGAGIALIDGLYATRAPPARLRCWPLGRPAW